MVILDDKFHGIPQGRQLFDLERGAADEAHFQKPLTYPSVSQNLGHRGRIPGLEITEGYGFAVRHVLNSSFQHTILRS